MIGSSPDLLRDLRALAYLDALDTGDLLCAAAYWDEISHDRELQQMLDEFAGQFFVETVPPCHPSTIGVLKRGPNRSAIWIGVVAAVAAASVLGALIWPRHG